MSESFLPLTSGYNLVRKTRSAQKWHFLWISELGSECILCHPLLFIFLSWEYVIKSQSSKREGIKNFLLYYFVHLKVIIKKRERKEKKKRISKKQNADFIKKTNFRKLLHFERELQREWWPFTLRATPQEGSGEQAWKLESPEYSPGRLAVACAERVGIFVLIPVLFGVMISTTSILLNKVKWVSEWAWTTSTLIRIK